MRFVPTRQRLLVLALGLVPALGIGTYAVAQAPDEATRADAPEQEDPAEDPIAQIPESLYVETAQESIDAMRASVTFGVEELADAREKKDAVQITCVNEQLTVMKGILSVSEDALVSLRGALSESDTELSRYEFRKIQVSKSKMDELVQAVVDCAGAEASESNTSVEMLTDPSLSEIDPYYGDPSFFFDPAESLVFSANTGLGQEDPPDVRPPPASDVLN